MKNLLLKAAILLPLFLTGCSKESPTDANNQNDKGLIFANSNPPGAEIFLQNTSMGKFTPDSIKNLAPDTYDIRLKLNELIDSSLAANVKAGLKTTVYVDFTRTTGILSISSSPQGAQIFVNMINIGKTTPDSIYLKPSNYLLKLQLNPFDDKNFVVTINLMNTTYIYFDYLATTSTTTTSTISTTATISGVGTLPTGVSGNIQNTRVALYTSVDDWNFDRVFAFTACDGNGNYTMSNIVSGVYYMDAWKDNNNNQVWGDSGDYIWVLGSGVYPNYTLNPIQLPAGQVTTQNFEVYVVP